VNAYVIEGDGIAIVDCGLHTDDAEHALRHGLAALGRGLDDVRDVFVTHLHPDHIGMAGWLEERGARVTMHGPEADAARALWFAGIERINAARDWFRMHGMPLEVANQMHDAWLDARLRVDPIAHMNEADDGETIRLAGRSFRLMWTPGHTDYHAVLYEPDARVLVAGDHVLPRITPNVGLYPFSREDPLSDFLGALRKVRGMDARRVLPAHGDPFDDLAGRATEIADHHRARLAAIQDALGNDEHHAYAIARRLFPNLRSAHEERFAHAEVLAHLRHLERRGVVESLRGTPVRWRVVT
jgi:glyoxylase-like metal-dependent hydrolase (beta-lactamase superfamily II)